MATALGITHMDQSPFVASNVDDLKDGYGMDIGSPMQQDQPSPIVAHDREQQLAAMKVPTPEELEKVGFTTTERMSAFNQEHYPECYAQCKQLYNFGREHITKLIVDIPLDPNEDKELWERNAKLYMRGCEEVNAWLDAQDALDDDDWEDEEEEAMKLELAIKADKDAKIEKDGKDVKDEPSDAAKQSGEIVASKD